MSDIASNARSARESLARGLNLLQANPNAPPDYLQAAEPIAMAMGALHRIEKEGAAALKPSATEALDAVRAALSILQSKAAADPHMMQTMEAVASSLGTIFGLTKSAELVSVAAPQPVQQAPYQPPVQPYQPPVQQPYQPPVQQAPYQPPPVPQTPYQPPPAQAYQSPVQQAPYQPPPQVQPQQPYAPPQPPTAQPMQPQPAYAPAPVPAYAPPPQPQAGFKPPGVASPAAPNPAPAGGWSESDPFAAPRAAAPAAAAPAASPDAYRGADVPIIEAELGTHSVTNFYRGLSGSDVVDHGGLFVATYNVPHVGQTLKVQVSLPGGYEFEAIGVVRWTRESRESMTSDVSPPGCGVQFTHISPEARQLVYRYVRNREPLFHDDL
jgi:Tfp pilus assembly protein PilZ